MSNAKLRLTVVVLFAFMQMAGQAGDEKNDTLPVLKYDFSSDVIKTSGTGGCGAPQFMAKPGMDIIGQGRAVAFDGQQSFVLVPQSENLHLNDGATLHAVVKFNDSGIEGGQADAHDMLLFKDNEFLFGRASSTIYFNAMSDKKWAMTCSASFNSAEWAQLAVTMEKNDNAYTVRMYINGNGVLTNTFPGVVPDKTTNLVNIGKGWGGPWFMRGDVAEIAVFSAPLGTDEIARMYKSAPYVNRQP